MNWGWEWLLSAISVNTPEVNPPNQGLPATPVSQVRGCDTCRVYSPFVTNSIGVERTPSANHACREWCIVPRGT